MNIYVETNFILELVFQQEQFTSCQEILDLAEAGRISLVIPAYSLVEPHEKLIRRERDRKKLKDELDRELRELRRDPTYRPKSSFAPAVSSVLIKSSEEEQKRFRRYRDRLLKTAEIVPTTSTIVSAAAMNEGLYALSPQDALVFTSIVDHLQTHRPVVARFLDKNSIDFDNPSIVSALEELNCKILFRFDHSLAFVKSQI